MGGTVPGPFAYAERWDEATGDYAGLLTDNAPAAHIVIDSDSVIVAAAAAEAARRKAAAASGGIAEPAGPGAGSTSDGTAVSSGTGASTVSPPAAVAVKKRFYGTVSLDPIRAKIDFSTVVDEVVEHFTKNPGAEVKISVDIQAEAAGGFDEQTQRTVRENCSVLNFQSAEFEKGD